jgi:hypothetical protein
LWQGAKMSNKKVGTYNSDAINGKTFIRRKYFKIEENKSNIYRLLPPFGSLSDSQRIAAYYQIFFLKGASGKVRVVPTILRKSKDKGIIQRCPIVDKVEMLQKQLEVISNDPNYDQNMVKAKKEQLFNLRLQGAFYVNVIDQAGDIGVLKVPYTAFQSLKKRLEQLKSEGVDPINVGPQNGVFFDFKRYKDEKSKTIYEVEVSQKTRRDENGRLLKEYNWAPIDENVLNRMSTEAVDLGEMYRVFSLEEMNLLATLDPNIIDQVFASPEKSEEDEFDAEDYKNKETPEEMVQTTTVRTNNTIPVATSTANVSVNTFNGQAALKVNTPMANNDDLINQFLKNK